MFIKVISLGFQKTTAVRLWCLPAGVSRSAWRDTLWTWFLWSFSSLCFDILYQGILFFLNWFCKNFIWTKVEHPRPILSSCFGCFESYLHDSSIKKSSNGPSSKTNPLIDLKCLILTFRFDRRLHELLNEFYFYEYPIFSIFGGEIIKSQFTENQW